MKLKEMFQKRKNYIVLKDASGKTAMDTMTDEKTDLPEEKPEVPEGLLKKCNACKSAIFTEDVKNGFYICPKCRNYFRVHAYRRIEMVTDEGTFEEWDKEMSLENPLQYKGYEEKVRKLQEKTHLDEAIVTGKAKIGGKETVIGVCDGRFMMASMGHVVGEKIARAVERATCENLPVILFACSGGARMQEGMVSLMQMAKTAAAIRKHSDAGLLYISVLTDPTTGGVTASYAMLGDIILAEPNALIGFAGPRVIEQTIGQKLPKGFQRAEFLLEHGFIDRIVEREEMKPVLARILSLHETRKAQEDTSASGESGDENPPEIVTKPEAVNKPESVNKPGAKEDLSDEVRNRLATPWDRVQISRMQDRPVGSDYLNGLFTDFMELHGDRYFKDDKAIVGGIADFHGRPVTVIAQEKGSSTRENIAHNFGMPSPDGYRKALRLMKQAEKFHRPVVCFVDTPGAFCGLEAEERGQGEAIARNLFEMSGLKTQILSIVIGEGGSGGALAMAVGDEVWMLENAVYSVLSPEGFASILWKDSKRAEEAAEVMKLTSRDLKKLGIIERIIPEPGHLSKETMPDVLEQMDHGITQFLEQYGKLPQEELLNRRYDRFRKY